MENKYEKQTTLKKPVTIMGVGLHSGSVAKITIYPAPVNFGIKFKRTDLKQSSHIEASYKNVNCTELSTSINKNGAEIKTIEHLLSALYILKIDNLLITSNCGEVPILDGSSSIFYKKIMGAGIKIQDCDRLYIEVKKEINVGDDSVYAKFSIFNGFKVDFRIKYNNAIINGTPSFGSYEDGVSNYYDNTSIARTFCFSRDIKELKKRGFIKGGNLNNAIVLSENLILNKEKLRIHDEFVQHKILDAIGDISLVGNQILGAYYGNKAGHGINNILIRKLKSNKSNYKIVKKIIK